MSNGLAEYKNPYTAREFTISEACEKLSSFCLEKQKGSNSYKLKKRHSYYYQVQCQLFCDSREWCDFVVNTEKDINIDRIYFDQTWWNDQQSKLHTFYFKSLLPELTSCSSSQEWRNTRTCRTRITKPCHAFSYCSSAMSTSL